MSYAHSGWGTESQLKDRRDPQDVYSATHSTNIYSSQAWGLISVLEKLKQEDCCDFGVGLGYGMNFRVR